MLFSVITKTLNWEILTKNLVTFKRCDRVKDEKYCRGSPKNPVLVAGFTKNQYIGANCLKGGDLGSLQI